jgi:hypothetical protein
MPKPPKSFGPSAARDQAIISNFPDKAAAPKRREQCRRALTAWREHVDMRDELILDALDAGMTEYEVEDISGVARSTIRRIQAQTE